MNVTSKLENDVSIKGRLSFKGNLYLDCPFEGQIESEGSLIVGEHANILGEVFVDSLTLYGRIEGNVHAKRTCTLKAKSMLHGDLNCERLSLIEGADFTGFATVVSDRSDLDPNAAKRDPWDYPAMEDDYPSGESTTEEEIDYQEQEAFDLPEGTEDLGVENLEAPEEFYDENVDGTLDALEQDSNSIEDALNALEQNADPETLPVEDDVPPPPANDKFSKFKK